MTPQIGLRAEALPRKFDELKSPRGKRYSMEANSKGCWMLDVGASVLVDKGSWT